MTALAGRDADDSHQRRPRIVGLVEGDSERALSGVGDYLFDALEQHFPVVARVNYAPRGAMRLFTAIATARRSRPAWRARFHTSRLSYRVLSATLAKRVKTVESEFDLALQIHGWVGNQPRPYALFVDQTRLMAERGWPEWMPFGARERSELLALERAMYADSFHVFVMGQPARDSLIRDYGIDEARITVIGGGLTFSSLPSPPEELTREPRILFVGRDFERKGGVHLLAAFEQVRRQIPDAVLDVVGVAHSEPQPGVRFHGKLADREQLAELYKGARVFCLPSLYEPFGFALLEAMATGIPCVGSEVQSIPEILDHGRAGLLVAPGDRQALATAVIRLLTDHAIARTLGLRGRDRVLKHYTWEQVAARIAPVIESAPW